MTPKIVDGLGIVHHRIEWIVEIDDRARSVAIRMAACGFLHPSKHGDVDKANADAPVTCLTCLVRAIEIPGCMHGIHGPVHACPFALRPGHEGPDVRCHCCPDCTAECAVDPCDQSCCAAPAPGVHCPECGT